MVTRRASVSPGSSRGVFFVLRKSGLIRIIFDAGLLNLQFQDPPRTALPSAAAFGGIEAPADKHLVLATADISNAFDGMAVPGDLASMFTLPSIRAKFARVSHFNGAPNPGSMVLTPYLRVLPMGWSWSLHLCQELVASQVFRGLECVKVVLDRRPPAQLEHGDDISLRGTSTSSQLAGRP